MLGLPAGVGRLWVAGLLSFALSLGEEAGRVVILVRHAERAGGMGADVGLSEAGRCRAKVLSTMLADSGIKAIYTSEVKRTQQTAEPLAEKLGIGPQVVPASKVEEIVAKLRQSPPDTASLVVGHSNTVPEIVKRLSGQTVAPIADDQFDRMFIVTINGEQSRVVLLHYPGCPGN